MTPEHRRERARKAANTRWSKPDASVTQSKALREAQWNRWQQAQVDPNFELNSSAANSSSDAWRQHPNHHGVREMESV